MGWMENSAVCGKAPTVRAAQSAETSVVNVRMVLGTGVMNLRAVLWQAERERMSLTSWSRHDLLTAAGGSFPAPDALLDLGTGIVLLLPSNKETSIILFAARPVDLHILYRNSRPQVPGYLVLAFVSGDQQE